MDIMQTEDLKIKVFPSALEAQPPAEIASVRPMVAVSRRMQVGFMGGCRVGHRQEFWYGGVGKEDR
jgi:UDP-N-acetylglucosamine enolpyruvyl transferase